MTQYIEKPTKEEKLAVMTGENDGRVLLVYLDQAEKAIIAHTGISPVPATLEHFILDLAAYRIVKRGADYQTSHSENGVSRGWATDVMDSPAGFWAALDKAVDELAINQTAGWII